MKSSLSLIAAFSVLAILTAGGRDAVAAGGATSIICVNPSTGAITNRSKCKKGEVRFSLSTLGTLGVQGPHGDNGAKGDKGDKGDRGVSAFDTLPSGVTVFGVIGADLEAPAASGDFGAFASFPTLIPVNISDSTVTVANTSAVSASCTGNSCLNTSELNNESANCTGTATAPTAPPGRVCIYPVVISNAKSIFGQTGPGPSTSGFGFEVSWQPTTTGDTYFRGVWAYTTP